MLLRFVKQKFTEDYRVTVGADLFTYDITVDGIKTQIALWDTAGQEKFQTIGAAFYRGSDACIVVGDYTNKKSLDAVTDWKKTFCENADLSDAATFPFSLLINKSDLVVNLLE